MLSPLLRTRTLDKFHKGHEIFVYVGLDNCSMKMSILNIDISFRGRSVGLIPEGWRGDVALIDWYFVD